MQTEATRTLVDDLARTIGSEQVKFDTMTRLLYSTDASNYQIMPIGVTFPRHVEDLIAIHETAQRHQVPILPRGGGSSLAGQTVGAALVIDCSRYLRRVRQINADTQSVIAEAGLILGQLNQQLAPLDLMFGPDPASAERATIGGCVGNNSTGAHSIVYGMTADHIRRLEVILPDGERVWLDADHPKLNQIRTKVSQIVTEHQAEIASRYPQTFRTVAGYALNKIDPDNVNLNWLFAGSEGSLGTIVSVELGLVARPPVSHKRLALVHFDSLRASLEATPRILEVNPSAIELLDKFLMDKTRQHIDYSRRLTFVEGDPAVVLIVEFVGDSARELDHHIENLKGVLSRLGHTGSITYANTPKEQSNVWEVRKAGLGLLLSQRGDAKPIAFVEDAAIPVEQLADYVSDMERLIESEGTTYAIYAHASAGCLHIRPLVNLKTDTGRRQYRNLGEGMTELALKYGGTITGEHGQGLARGEFIRRQFGDSLYGAFEEVKRLFDPDNRMNPGKIIDITPMDDPATLRFTPDYQVIHVNTRFDWSLDGGLNGAAEMCNGSGVCRKEDSGTMCPSYMATLDEAHATRGRANALRHSMTGNIPEGLASHDVKAVFDLCLSCKACKAECPSTVDVARMKSEFLASYHDHHGTPLTTRLFGNIHQVNKLGSVFPRLSNFMLTNPVGLLGAKLIGLPTERPLPTYAAQRFSRLPAGHYSEPDGILVIDTFTEYNHPEIGEAIVKVAQAMGAKLNVMRLPGQGCCGRPAMSKGLLDQAKRMANANIDHLRHQDNTPLIFLEPSCQSAFTDDYLGLVDRHLQPDAQRLAGLCHSAEEWLLAQMVDKGDRLHWDNHPRQILFHGHCHQKALWGTDATRMLLEQIPQATVQEIPSGCCGVAGSFGYEHYEVSQKIANDRLLPTIRQHPQAIVVAPGTSCRAQIQDNGHPVWHPVEVIGQALGVG